MTFGTGLIKYIAQDNQSINELIFTCGVTNNMTISRYITTQKVERPDIIVGIHPGLHAEGVYEFWEPTLELILDENIITVFTVLNEEEYSQTLGRLDHLFCKYLYKGKNPFASRHVKQTPHDPELMWASNMYIIVIKVSSCKVLPSIIGSLLITKNCILDKICYLYTGSHS